VLDNARKFGMHDIVADGCSLDAGGGEHDTYMAKYSGALPFKIAGRYEVRELLGRGGMASVCRAWDERLRTEVALKLLTVEGDCKQIARSTELFEREFHTLAELCHPRIVRAIDYGVDDEQPYYSLELLDGGDLRELAPLPWQDVCTIAYELCSALSLLHSRGLVHRDLTPRNVRRTRSGQSKLIDFGLLSPVGPTTLLAGTAPFVPPELLRTMSLDGRSDLFSLGATLYYALTRRTPYPARSFEHLQDAWRSTPARPSNLIAGIPPALDDLVLGMLRIDAGSRPKSAAEVMERLVPLLPGPAEDELRAARAYLSTPRLVGRDHLVAQFRKRMMRAAKGHGGGFAVVGAEGAGRSRMVDAFVLEAKLIGAIAVRAGRDEGSRAFGVAAAIAEQIHRAAPAVARAVAAEHPSAAALYPQTAKEHANSDAVDLIDVTRPELDRADLQGALRTWILEIAARRPLAIAVDDLDRVDEPSASLLASLTWASTTRRLVYLAVLPPGDGLDQSATGLLRKHADEMKLDALTADEVTELFASLFGNVPNLGVLSARFMKLSGGRPRECMMFAQYLVDSGAITYAGGSWTLPAEIPDTLLPANLEAAFTLRLARLGPVARHVGALLSENIVDTASRADLLSIGFASSAGIDAGLAELAAARMITGEPAAYAVTGSAIARMLSGRLDEHQRRQVHDQVSVLHERAGRHPLLVAYHALRGSGAARALADVARLTPTTDERAVFFGSALDTLSESKIAVALDAALDAAQSLNRPVPELQSIRGMLAGVACRGADPKYFYEVADAWLRQAKHDSGYDEWQSLDASLDGPTRAMMAVGAAARRYADSSSPARGQSPQEGIQQLVAYVLFAIAISSRVLDRSLQVSLSELLVPFAPLSPLVAAILGDARAACMHGGGQRELARERFSEVLTQLDAVSGDELRYVDAVRGAVCFALASIDTSFGVSSPWLDRISDLKERNQQVNALFLRKLAALQQGDWELAEQYRKDAELLALQIKGTSMFSTLGDELDVHSLARDLTGLRQVRAGIRAKAERFPGWVPVLNVADAHYCYVCGDLDGALAALVPVLDACTSDSLQGTWHVAARVLQVHLLCELDRAEEAIARGTPELARCEAMGMRQQARSLMLSIASAEAKLGRHAEGSRRADAVIAEQRALGVTGLQLGKSYEVSARIAIFAKDAPAFRHFATLANEQYRAGKSSVLGALYERLMDEGRKAGLVDATVISVAPQRRQIMHPSPQDWTTLIDVCEGPKERGARALALLCDGDPPTRGHLLVRRPEGVVLAASNVPCASVSEVVAFASECLDREDRAATMETDALSSASLGTLAAEWRDAEGIDYETVLLATTVCDAFCIAGVALLAKAGEPRAASLTLLADSVARVLIKFGDAIIGSGLP
jgi:hypothetical protein